LLKILEWNVLYCNYFTQKIGAYIIKKSDLWFEEAVIGFQKNRDILCEWIQSSEIFSTVKPMGNPFILLNVSRIKLKCEEVSDILLERFGIPSVPGTYLKARKHIRIAFGGDQDEIEELVYRMEKAERYFLKEKKVTT
jgi:aspartate/methionine/tyrosine aminotransferase